MKKQAAAYFIFGFLCTASLAADEGGVLVLTLDEAKARAEQNSRELHILALHMRTQQYSFGLGARVFLPTMSVGFNQSDSVSMLAPGDTTKKTFSLTLHQPLFDGGRTIFQRRVQKLELALQEYDYVKKREALLDQTWTLYHQLLLIAEKRRLQEEFHSLALQQLAVSRKEHELGAATEIEYLDAALEVKSLEEEMEKSKVDEETLRFQFLSLCGLPRSRPVRLAGSIDFTYAGMEIPDDPDFWFGVALDRNIDYRRAQFESAKMKKEYEIARTAWIPTVGADLTFSLSGEGFPLYEPGFAFKLTFQFPFNEAPTKTSLNASSSSVGQRSFTADASTDILPNLTYLSDERLARLKIQSSDLERESAEENLRFNIEQYLKNHSAERRGLALKKETLALLERKQRVTREQLGIGEIKRIDYLKAQNDYYSREIAIRESIFRLIQMERGFEQLLGLEAGELARFMEKRRWKNVQPQGALQ